MVEKCFNFLVLAYREDYTIIIIQEMEQNRKQHKSSFFISDSQSGLQIEQISIKPHLLQAPIKEQLIKI